MISNDVDDYSVVFASILNDRSFIWLKFSITLTKAQGQRLEMEGIYLPKPAINKSYS